jgi:hypothetical protein
VCCWVVLKTVNNFQFSQDTLCPLWHTDNPIPCSQQPITGRYAEPEECSPQHQHGNSVLGKCICEVGRQEITKNFYTLLSPYKAYEHIFSVTKFCKHCRCSCQQWKPSTRWTNYWWKTGKNWTLSSSGKVIELLLNRTRYLIFWNKTSIRKSDQLNNNNDSHSYNKVFAKILKWLSCF